MKLLICEGLCNPCIHELDAEVSKATEHDDRPLIKLHLIVRQHALLHTEHEEIRNNTMMCSVCKTERKY